MRENSVEFSRIYSNKSARFRRKSRFCCRYENTRPLQRAPNAAPRRKSRVIPCEIFREEKTLPGKAGRTPSLPLERAAYARFSSSTLYRARKSAKVPSSRAVRIFTMRSL